MKHSIINADCGKILSLHARECRTRRAWQTCFADPPDNIGNGYGVYDDDMPDNTYVSLLRGWLYLTTMVSETVWFSYNTKWSFEVGRIICDMLNDFNSDFSPPSPGTGKARSLCNGFGGRGEIEIKQCVQTFTFGQHNHHDLGNNYRPLLRIRLKTAPLFPDAIRCQSERQKMGDKRADPRGRVPGDVFDFPRVTGNSKQRRSWHPTQLNEGLVERCLKLTTPKGGSVLDPFAGTGTTLRVCKRIGMDCTLIEIDPKYCELIAKEHNLKVRK